VRFWSSPIRSTTLSPRPLLNPTARMGFGSAFAQVRCDHRPEMVRPAPVGLTGDHDPAFRQQIFDVAEAQREPEMPGVYLWRAVDAEGEVLDVLVQTRRNKRAALKLMRQLQKKNGFVPDKLVQMS
jgi:DDE domain